MRIVEFGSICWEGFSTRCSSASTTPAITIACAFVRDSASPRSTSSLSIRSRFTFQDLQDSCKPCLRASRYCPRRLIQMQLRRTFITQPHDDLRRIRPEKRSHLRRHLHRIGNTQPLQGLKVKRPIVEITASTFLAVKTLPLTKHLPRHDVHHTRACIARKTDRY